MEKTQEKIVTAALTRRQGDIYRYLLDHLHGFEHPPTLDVLCRALGLRSKGSLYKHIQALVLAGLVEPMNRKHRGIRLTAKRAQESTGFPLLGSIAAGRPIEAIEDPETIGIPEFFHGKINCYLLNVNGNSMAEEGILDGDRVVIERRDYARNGEIVVALIDGYEATLKRIEQKPGKIILYPANSNLEPVVYAPNRVQIQGVLVGLMRSYL